MTRSPDTASGPLPVKPKAWAQWLMRRIGWSLDLPTPPGPRFVLVMYPHTSNWDFIIGLIASYAAGWPVRWVGKHSLFRPPLGTLFRALGGIPVNRATPGTLLNDLTRYGQTHEHAVICIAPEGTRSHVSSWKSGFHRIARAANIPIALGFIDYRTRTVGVLDYLTATDDFAEDMRTIARHYTGVEGRHPACAGAIVARED